MKKKKIGIEEDPLKFWAGNKTELPTLSALAREFLGSPPSSAPSEREFKVAKNLQKDRVKLLPKNVEMLLFLKYNLRAINYATNLESPPEDFMPPNSHFYDEINDNSDSDSDQGDSEMNEESFI